MKNKYNNLTDRSKAEIDNGSAINSKSGGASLGGGGSAAALNNSC